MKIAIASGKGGTGKTTVSIALANAMDRPLKLLDCDVEEPNCHLFYKETSDFEGMNIYQQVPEVDPKKCDGCGKCAEICQFNSIMSIKGSAAMVFPEMCHACGGCFLICPQSAIREIPFKIGALATEKISAEKELITGFLDIGIAMAPPVIKNVLKEVENYDGLVIIDSPPGTSCPFVTTVKASDFVVFVAEPTPFGLNDLQIAVETVREIGIPFAVIINRATSSNNIITEYCIRENIRVLIQIEDSRKVAEVYSNGGTLIDALPHLKNDFATLLREVESECSEVLQ